MKKLKVIQVGILHEHSGAIMNSLRMMEDVFEVLGYVDETDFVKSVYFPVNTVEPYKGIKRFSFDEALHHPDVEAFLVEVPNNDLADVTLKLLERKLPVHWDKPGGEEPDTFKKVIDVCRRNDIPLHMGYMFRSNPAMTLCRELAASGGLGDILELSMDMNHDYGNEDYMRYLKGFTGGVMYNLGCHIFDFVALLLGRPDNVVPFLKNIPGTGNGVCNNTMAVLEYPHTLVTATVSCGRVDGMKQRRLLVSGTKGTFEVYPVESIFGDEFFAELWLKEDAGKYHAGVNRIPFGTPHRYREHLLEFAKIARREIENPVSFEHELLVHEITLAAAGKIKWSK